LYTYKKAEWTEVVPQNMFHFSIYCPCSVGTFHTAVKYTTHSKKFQNRTKKYRRPRELRAKIHNAEECQA
jgi:hypothetical protein